MEFTTLQTDGYTGPLYEQDFLLISTDTSSRTIRLYEVASVFKELGSSCALKNPVCTSEFFSTEGPEINNT